MSDQISMNYTCVYCTKTFHTFRDIITHTSENHSNKELQIRVINNSKIKTKNFKIIPDLCREHGRVVTVDDSCEKIHVSKEGTLPKNSPMKKILKLETNETIVDTSNLESESILYEEDDCQNSQLKQLEHLLPAVVDTLEDAGKLKEYIAFNRLLAEGKFPLSNIAFLLFLDVVRWYDLDETTTSMRYNPDVKLFWSTGSKLFKGRFLRFMGGPKNKFQGSEDEAISGHYTPETSKINFIVPDRRMLKEECQFVKTGRPGILSEMIETVGKTDSEQCLTYKVCVDGKKLNPSSKGEVDLWGHESEPTFEKKQERLKVEQDYFINMADEQERLTTMGYSSIQELRIDEIQNTGEKCRNAITKLSHRIMDLRKLKVGKESLLKKLEMQCQDDWRNSRYAMVISSIRTSIYQIENTIEELLHVNEVFCKYASCANGCSHILATSVQVCLGSQPNYVCLGNGNANASAVNNDMLPESTTLTKQRSDKWFELRERCLVTGSTINKAIGLEGLKSQKAFIDIKTGKTKAEQVSNALQSKFDYGTANEINAVATLASIVLPAFEPSGVLFEEGCYVETDNDSPYLIVSPDGSVRDSEDEGKVIAAVEIKCPYPGKTYTTPVHYMIPQYYIPQILSEMQCLRAEFLYFVSYGKESTVILKATFDNDLWRDISKEIQLVSANQNPKKLSERLLILKKEICKYCKTNVTLVAEVKSKMATPCEHKSDIFGRIYHEKRRSEKDVHVLYELHKTTVRARDLTTTCHKLCAQKASEVLVFLLSDLDRIHKPDVPHAYPIAYALKGYSMKGEAMRQMIGEVLHSLFLNGLYTPAVSYDGQWAALSSKTIDGEPLTLLELQKHVYNVVKSRTKSELTKQIFETAVVKSESIANLLVVVRDTSDTRKIEVALRSEVKLFRASSHTKQLLVSQKQQPKTPASQCKDTDILADIDQVFTGIPRDILSNIDKETIECISALNSKQNTGVTVGSLQCKELGIQDLFNDEIAETEDTNTIYNCENSPVECDVDMEVSQTDNQTTPGREIPDAETVYDHDTILGNRHIVLMMENLSTRANSKLVWQTRTLNEFQNIVMSVDMIRSGLTKQELIVCLESVEETLKTANVSFYKSWNKTKLADVLHSAFTCNHIQSHISKTKRKRNPQKLAAICKHVINRYPKSILNAVVAEHEMPDRVVEWRDTSPFAAATYIDTLDTKVTWFSKPEYNKETLAYVFSYLDVHHLITNCRVKVCKDGFPVRNISKKAWLDVAKQNTTKLKVSHVEDLIDKQSDAIARETFSEGVEKCMRELSYHTEADFCKLVREFYEAEDDPGLSAVERCERRLNLKTWLLDGVNFLRFPPYGSHIRDVPHVMFQGFLTNIDRRIQIIPYVKSGHYNVRSLGTLEAENLFGEFQDLDPKGSGVIKAEEVPAALESACQLLKTRVMPDRPFHMTLSKAKVYPTQGLVEKCDQHATTPFLYPSSIWHITPRDHAFDLKSRAKRKPKRRLVQISGPDEPARGVAPVRQFHRCDESKIPAHKRLGIELD